MKLQKFQNIKNSLVMIKSYDCIIFSKEFM